MVGNKGRMNEVIDYRGAITSQAKYKVLILFQALILFPSLKANTLLPFSMLLSVGEGEAPFCINNFVLNYFKLDIMSLIMQQ